MLIEKMVGYAILVKGVRTQGDAVLIWHLKELADNWPASPDVTRVVFHYVDGQKLSLPGKELARELTDDERRVEFLSFGRMLYGLAASFPLSPVFLPDGTIMQAEEIAAALPRWKRWSEGLVTDAELAEYQIGPRLAWLDPEALARWEAERIR